MTNPTAVSGGFFGAPEYICEGQGFPEPRCNAGFEGDFVRGTPFTVVGTLGVSGGAGYDGLGSTLRVAFKTPESYTYAVRDAEGNVILESEWLVNEPLVPEPGTISTVGAAIAVIGLSIVRRKKSA